MNPKPAMIIQNQAWEALEVWGQPGLAPKNKNPLGEKCVLYLP